MTQRDEAIARIRRIILGGELHPGVRTSERAVSEEFLDGMLGRTPVREALAILTAQGIIEQYPQVGFEVRRVDADEALNALVLLHVTQQLVVAEATSSNVDTAPLLQITDEIVRAAVQGDSFETLERARSFHITLADIAGYTSASDALGGFRDRFALFLTSTRALEQYELFEAASGYKLLTLSLMRRGDAAEQLTQLRDIETRFISARKEHPALPKEPRTEPVEILNVLRSVAARGKLLAQARGVTLQTDLPSEPINIETDPEMFRQITFNLIQNAVTFTDKEAVTLHAKMEKDTLLIKVTDGGYGGHAESVDQIFEPFLLGGQGLAHGAGLGLSVVRALVQALGGEVEVESAPGGGSRSSVHLPQRKPISLPD